MYGGGRNRPNSRDHTIMSNGGSGSHYLEQENDQLTDKMREKLSTLKSLSLDIESEVKDHNKLLDEIDSDFGSSTGLLGSTMRRLGLVSKTGGSRSVCYLALFAFAVFLVIYFISSRGSE